MTAWKKQSRATVVVEKIEFDVDDKLIISDPCYIDGDDAVPTETTRHLTVLDDAIGTWTATIEMWDTHGWGDRVGKLVLERQGTRVRGSEQFVGYNSVDSGQMYAGCLSNAPLDYDEVLIAAGFKREGPGIPPSPPEGSMEIFRAAEGGAVSDTGIGDGRYSVMVANDTEGHPARVVVVFEDDDEEEC